MEKVTNFSGERLKGIRRRTGLTQQQVGDAIGYARSTIGVWEKGHDLPGRDALILLAEFFGLSVDRFLSGAASPAGPPKGAEFAKDANELALLEFWRELTPEQRILIRAVQRYGMASILSSLLTPARAAR